MKKHGKVRRRMENPQFPKWKTPQNGAGFLFGAVLWILMILGFLFLFYVQLFSFNLKYLLQLITPGNYEIPFWFSILIVIFLFPVSLAVILAGAFLRIIFNR